MRSCKWHLSSRTMYTLTTYLTYISCKSIALSPSLRSTLAESRRPFVPGASLVLLILTLARLGIGLASHPIASLDHEPSLPFQSAWQRALYLRSMVLYGSSCLVFRVLTSHSSFRFHQPKTMTSPCCDNSSTDRCALHLGPLGWAAVFLSVFLFVFCESLFRLAHF